MYLYEIFFLISINDISFLFLTYYENHFLAYKTIYFITIKYIFEQYDKT